jgi:hypothetical protein
MCIQIIYTGHCGISIFVLDTSFDNIMGKPHPRENPNPAEVTILVILPI